MASVEWPWRRGRETTETEEKREASSDQFEQTYAGPQNLLQALAVVSHKPVGLRFIRTAFAFLLAGGIIALLMRTQLAAPGNDFLSAQSYNQFFTMHGTTMMFVFAVPMVEGFANYLVPLMVGSRDLPYPRLNAFGYFMFLFGALFVYASFIAGSVPDNGWFAYVPLSSEEFSPGRGMDFWLIGLALLEISGIGAAIEIIVATFKTRAPGMSINRIPLFVWSALAMAFMIVFAFPPLLVGSGLLTLDRKIGTQFFDSTGGGDPVLWQHLFWIFGHPEVYIQFLPAAGVISMIIPVFARRRMLGYTFIVVAVVATAFISFGLWVHHMFTVGLPPMALNFFTAASVTIPIATGIQYFAWLGTLWTGRPRIKIPLLFALGFIVIFLIGGLTGPMIAAAPFDWQTHDTFFIVAHFHYVLIGGVVFPIFAGFYYWFPKVTGRMLSERIGTWNFWLMFIGFNVAFFPMHILGILGMPRRVYTYESGLGWDGLNLIATIGAYVLALGILLFIVNVIRSYIPGQGEEAGKNPWGADSLEWAADSPPSSYNFKTIPIVHDRHPLWTTDDRDRQREVDEPEDGMLTGTPNAWRATLGTSVLDAIPESVIYLPSMSYTPFIAAIGVTLAAVGTLLNNFILLAAGGLIAVVAIVAWMWPTRAELDLPEVDEEGRMAGLPVHISGSPAVGWWGNVAFMTVLAAMGASLVFSYFYLWGTSDTWPIGAIGRPALVLPSIATALLVISVVPVFWASRSIRSGQRFSVALGLGLAFILGVIFLAIEAFDFMGFDFTHQTNAYGSLVYVLGAFYGSVLLIGLGINLFTLLGTVLGYFDQRRNLAVHNTALYWYFLVITGLVFFAVLYLVPYFV